MKNIIKGRLNEQKIKRPAYQFEPLSHSQKMEAGQRCSEPAYERTLESKHTAMHMELKEIPRERETNEGNRANINRNTNTPLW